MPTERPPITVLDRSVIAGIAAGEVVERPASVVKELVENALDAGATRVSVDYDDRRETAITVIDDGHGIAEHEIELALTRHATSKLMTLEDLGAVATFGFRGEALASLAAVSELELVTATADAVGATRVRVRGGCVVERSSAGAAAGTRVEVRDLFAAVPARRKFLKSATTEAALVADTVRRFALLRPRAHLRLRRNGRAVLDLPALDELGARVRQVLGREAGTGLEEVGARFAGMGLHGFLSPAGVSHGSPRRMNVFVNGRWVRDRLLFRSVMEGYHTFLLKGRYPVAVLFLEADPATLDVNVHPAKLEVRFADANVVRRFVTEAVRDCLREAASPLGRWGMDEGEAARRRLVPGSQGEPRSRGAGNETGADATALANEPKAGEAAGVYSAPPTVGPDTGGSERPLPGYRPSSVAPAEQSASEEQQPRLAFGAGYEEGRLGCLEVIGQAFDGYIVCEGEGELVLVDQHAAHERMLFERLMLAYASREVERQGMLLPARVTVGEAGVEAVERCAAELATMGWEIDPFGAAEVVVRSVPAIAAGADVGALAEALIADLCELGTALTAVKLAERVFATVACHSAVRVGKTLDRTAAAALLRELSGVEFHASCPHGRPVARSLTRVQVERLFGR